MQELSFADVIIFFFKLQLIHVAVQRICIYTFSGMLASGKQLSDKINKTRNDKLAKVLLSFILVMHMSSQQTIHTQVFSIIVKAQLRYYLSEGAHMNALL